MSHCSASGRALTQALRNKYRLVDSLHYTAFYWLKHNEPGYAIYCLRNLARLATEQEDEYRLKWVFKDFEEMLFLNEDGFHFGMQSYPMFLDLNFFKKVQQSLSVKTLI